MKNLNKKSLKDFKSKSLKNSHKIFGGTNEGPENSRGTVVIVKGGDG